MSDQGLDSGAAVPERIGDLLWWLSFGGGGTLYAIHVDPHGGDSFDLRVRVIALVGS